VNQFEEYVKSIGVLSDEEIDEIKNEFKEKIEDELKIALLQSQWKQIWRKNG
jgi:TPP-dependent pyruvate/acetoin dehydrogenase alpha subunit